MKVNVKRSANVNNDKQCHECEQLKQELLSCEEGRKRVLADYDNLLKRTREERDKLIKMASADVLISLMEPIDHLEMAAAHLKDQGLSMVVTQFIRVLEEQGVTSIDALNKPFNEETMEAIEVVDGPANIVVRVDKKGYMLNGVVLRHAKVSVGKGE